jgi:hypothetical protein
VKRSAVAVVLASVLALVRSAPGLALDAVAI